MPSAVELRIFGPHWSLPSFDSPCLAAALIVEQWCKQSSREFNISDTNDPTEFSSGELPVLIDYTSTGKQMILQGLTEIIDHLKRWHGFDCDKPLSMQPRSQSAAFVTLMEECLYPAMLHSWWANDENRAVLERIYAYKMPISARLRYIYGGQLHQWSIDRLSYINRATSLSSVGDPAVYISLRQAYHALSTLLGDKQYFFGTDHPTLLDYIAFSHLALHLYAEIPHRHLQVILNFEFPALVKFTERFRHTHIPTGVVNERIFGYSESIWAHFKAPQTPFDRLKGFYRVIMDETRELLASVLPAAGARSADKGGARDNTAASSTTKELTKAELIFRRNRNLSIGGAIAGFLFYIWHRGLVRVEFSAEGDQDNADDDGEQDDETNQSTHRHYYGDKGETESG